MEGGKEQRKRKREREREGEREEQTVREKKPARPAEIGEREENMPSPDELSVVESDDPPTSLGPRKEKKRKTSEGERKKEKEKEKEKKKKREEGGPENERDSTLLPLPLPPLKMKVTAEEECVGRTPAGEREKRKESVSLSIEEDRCEPLRCRREETKMETELNGSGERERRMENGLSTEEDCSEACNCRGEKTKKKKLNGDGGERERRKENGSSNEEHDEIVSEEREGRVESGLSIEEDHSEAHNHRREKKKKKKLNGDIGEIERRKEYVFSNEEHDETVSEEGEGRTESGLSIEEDHLEAHNHRREKNKKKKKLNGDDGDRERRKENGFFDKENDEIVSEERDRRMENGLSMEEDHSEAHNHRREKIKKLNGDDGERERRKENGFSSEEVHSEDDNHSREKIKKKKKKKLKVDEEHDLTAAEEREGGKENGLSTEEGHSWADNHRREKTKKKKLNADDGERERRRENGFSSEEVHSEIAVQSRKKTKKNSTGNDGDEASKTEKRVRFSEHVEMFTSSQGDSDSQTSGDPHPKVIWGKRFTPEEDEIIKKAVSGFIKERNLGEKGLEIVLNCGKHKGFRNCWSEIATCLPHRPRKSVRFRAHVLLEEGTHLGLWSEEEVEIFKKLQAQHGNRWREISEQLGRGRENTKEKWRSVKRSGKKGRRGWTQEELQELSDLVHKNLGLKATRNIEDNREDHRILRDDINWETIADKIQVHGHGACCTQWYYTLASPMVVTGEWATGDDRLLLESLLESGACSEEEVQWDDLLDNRSGKVCMKRWQQMGKYLGENRFRLFSEKLDLLAHRYAPDLLEA